MLGWEFPPYHSGGLGTACHGLTKGLANQGVNVTFVLPSLRNDVQEDFVKLLGANIRYQKVDSPLKGYTTETHYQKCLLDTKKTKQYGDDLLREVNRFAERICHIAEHEDFDIIHAHDWLTYLAGIRVKEKTGKPLVIHVHATEFDRCASSNVNPEVYAIERKGMQAADNIIAVSNFTKSRVVNNYGIAADRVNVVHNGVIVKQFDEGTKPAISETDKIVLFLGRITIQKGPEYFLHTAKKIMDKVDNVKFVVAGSGDMDAFMINKAAELGLGKNVLFTGFLRGADVDRAYRMADVYVMPSVSEPFGITPLEAMMHGTPTVISKQSGVSEVVNHAFKVDFWDVDEMANKIIGILKYPCLADSMSKNAGVEIHDINWNESARKCKAVYEDTLGGSVW